MSHDKRFAVKTYLEAGDFLAFEELCAEEGISQSSDLSIYTSRIGCASGQWKEPEWA